MSGLAPQSLLGPNYAIARAIYFRKIGRGGEGFFEFPAYLGMSLEIGNTWERRGDMSFGSAHKDASVFIAFDTFLGSGVPRLRLRSSPATRGVLPVPGQHVLRRRAGLAGSGRAAGERGSRLEVAALGEILDFLEHQRRLVADARVFVLARHVLEHAVALGGGEEPMRLLPVGAEQLGKGIPGLQAHANAVRARQHRQGATIF